MKSVTNFVYSPSQDKIDSMSHDFPTIVLTTHEMKLLKRLLKKNIISTKENEVTASRLIKLHFIRELKKESIYFYEIRSRGKNYLLYSSALKKEKRVEWIRYLVTTAIAIIALAVAVVSLIKQGG